MVACKPLWNLTVLGFAYLEIDNDNDNEIIFIAK